MDNADGTSNPTEPSTEDYYFGWYYEPRYKHSRIAQLYQQQDKEADYARNPYLCRRKDVRRRVQSR